MTTCLAIFWFVQPCGLHIQKFLCTQVDRHSTVCIESMHVVTFLKISLGEYIKKLVVVTVCFSEALDMGISENVTCWHHINNFLIIILDVCFWESSILRLTSWLSKSKGFPRFFFSWILFFFFFFSKNSRRKSWCCPLVKHRLNMLLQLTPKSLGVKTSEISWAPVQKKTLAHP